MTQQPGVRQHIIPASHIGSFSNSDITPKRKRPVWYRRDGMKNASDLKAETLGIRKHIYTLYGENLEERYVDKTWKYVEENLPSAVQTLEEHNKTLLFNGTIWSTILVPFIAQLFVRGEDYGELLLARAPALEKLDEHFGPHGVSDNTNFNRLIDFQINCGLLCNAEWRLLHNQSKTPFVLSDLGYATFNAQRYGYGLGKGYLIPMSKTLMLVITRRNPKQEAIHIYGPNIMLLQGSLTDSNKARYFNQRIVKCAYSEAYGPTEEVLNQSWGNREIRRKDPIIGPALIQYPLKDKYKLDIHQQYMDKFKVPDLIIKEMYGGRIIEVVEETRGNSTYMLRYKEL
ncbi:DUF4238 domain-containing protein [Paenibacillus mendelii]|uniref:DUF4238 domain-containing protein n=1 Tax=Paenibacillus mendelii TaxID=206163 RepID=A0ABV6JEM0_9BACL|nr:DUF4238 domain-containing protein [Paenibacillus mendelii]MCQ6563488.1 DUF4238 domain-containing protein [Paenibacillus mendelii]